MLKKLTFKTKILSLSIIPIIILIILLIRVVSVQNENLRKAEHTVFDLNNFSLISELIHNLQEERGYTVRYLVENTTVEFNDMVTIQLLNDEKIEVLKKIKGDSLLTFGINYLESELGKTRISKEEKILHKETIIQNYNILIGNLISLDRTILEDVNNIGMLHESNTILKLEQIKERIGNLRAEVFYYLDVKDSTQAPLSIIRYLSSQLQNDVKNFKFISNENTKREFNTEVEQAGLKNIFAFLDDITNQNIQANNIPSKDEWFDEASSIINRIKNVMNNQLKSNEQSILSNVAKIKSDFYLTIAGISLLILLPIVFSVFIIRDISSSVENVKHNFQELSNGNLDVSLEINTKDEFGSLSKSFNELVEVNKDVIEVAKSIGSGNYSQSIEPRSDNDELSFAIDRMREDLISLSEENKNKNWMVSGLAKFSQLIQENQEYETLAKNIIKELAIHLDIPCGAFFIVDTINGIGKLNMFGSYAYPGIIKDRKEVDFGEGLVGQCAAEKRIINLSGVPEDYIKIESGLGETNPKNLILVPISYEGKIKGVIELASLNKFTDLQIEFLQKLSGNIGLALNLITSRMITEQLLEESRTTNEKLISQEEELRVTNEELEEQAKLIRASEEELRSQQEELEHSNAALEEKAQLMEEQNESIRIKNEKLNNAQEALELKAKQLEQTSKYKSEFLANMSHELRTPLNSMLILSNLLKENKNGNLNEKQLEYANVINKSGQDLLNLINDILDLSKIEAGKIDLDIEEINIKDVANDMLYLFKEVAANKSVKFKINIEPDAPEIISSDKIRIEQILRNLLSNAFKFTPTHGTVELLISRKSKEFKFKNELYDEDNFISLTVEDSGIGIPIEKQKLIFEAFLQADGKTNRKYGGTGLGLSITRELVSLLGGEINLQSEVGYGSKFNVILPTIYLAKKINKKGDENKHIEKIKVNAHEINIQPEVINTNGSRTIQEKKNKTVLIIEDDKNFLNVLVEQANEKGFKSITATSGELGLKYAVSQHPDAIILDIGLPGIDGWQVMKQIKENPETREIPIHILSGSDNSKLGFELGAVEFLQKPISSADLKKAFDNISTEIENSIKHVLLIEDDEIEKELIIKVLHSNGIGFDWCKYGAEAMQSLKSRRYHAIICDLGLPDISGFELIKNIKENPEFTTMPVIVYTGRELNKHENDFLMKYSSTVVIKNIKSVDRLLDETTLFLRRIESHEPNRTDNQKNIPIEINGELKGKKILVVDDDMRNIFALSNVLEQHEIIVNVANDGKEALNRLDEKPDCELVLMDIMMPEMDGYEAMREIRKQERFKKLPIIALTAKAMMGDRERCINAGATDYISKPVDTVKLLSLIRVLLSR